MIGGGPVGITVALELSRLGRSVILLESGDVSADEPANVLRGAGFHFIADALTINPDIETEALRWGEPSWTKTDPDLRYQWYKETIDAAYYDGFRVEYAVRDRHGSVVRIADLGRFDWVATLTGDRRNRLVASAIGIQLVPGLLGR